MKHIIAILLSAFLVFSMAISVNATENNEVGDSLPEETTTGVVQEIIEQIPEVVPDEKPVQNQTETTGNTEVESTEDNGSPTYLYLFLSSICLLLFVLGTNHGEKARNCITILSDEIKTSDDTATENLENLCAGLEKLAEENPEIKNSETYENLINSAKNMEYITKERKVQHEKIRNIYRHVYKIDKIKAEKEIQNKTLKPFKMSGCIFVPYRTKEEYEQVSKKYANMPAFTQRDEDFECCFVAFNKKDMRYIGEFVFAKNQFPDAVDITYGTEDDADDKFVCKAIRYLSEYYYSKFDAVYFFFELDCDNENIKKNAKKYQLTPFNGSTSTYYIDLNAEFGLVSVISAL